MHNPGRARANFEAMESLIIGRRTGEEGGFGEREDTEGGTIEQG